MAHSTHAVEVRTPPTPHRGRSLALALALASAGALGSCSARNAPIAPGASDSPWPQDTPAASSSAHRPARWSDFVRIDDLTVIAPSFPSHGHGTGAWQAELRGNAIAAAGFDTLSRGASLAVGALLVQSHSQRHSGARLGHFAMRKREAGYFPAGGDWEFLVIDRDGSIAASGQLDACARCHADAAADFVFPRYRPAAASSGD